MKKLTKREKQVMELVSQGRLNKQIAFDLNVSSQTIKNHLYSIYSKLEARNRVQAVTVWWSKRGIK